MDKKEKAHLSENEAHNEALRIKELVGDNATAQDYSEASELLREESEKELLRFQEIQSSLLEFIDTLVTGYDPPFTKAGVELKKEYADIINSQDINGLHRLVTQMERWLYARRRDNKNEDYKKIDALQKKLINWLEGKN